MPAVPVATGRSGCAVATRGAAPGFRVAVRRETAWGPQGERSPPGTGSLEPVARGVAAVDAAVAAFEPTGRLQW